MFPRNCKSSHRPPESYGDCIAACVATITDDDNVPHVFNNEQDATDSWKQLRSYLATRNKNICLFHYEDHPGEFMKLNNPNVPYMLLCSNIDGTHAVVCINDQIYHDPAWYKRQITGPLPNGYYIIGVVV